MTERDAILVLDDDVDVASTLADFLTQRGHAVLVAHTGRDALVTMAERSVALLLLDLRLPDMHGTAVMRRARRLDDPPEIVVVTGHAALESAVEAVEAGAGGYILKPVDLARLGGIVDRILGRRRLQRDNERLTAENVERLRETQGLLAVSSTIASTLDLREALRRICRELTRLIGADTCAVYMHEAATDQLVAFAGYRVPRELVTSFLATPLPLREQGFHDPLWRDRRPVFTDDVSADPRFTHDLFRRHRHQSGLLLPLVLDGEVAGAFYLVWWKARHRPTERTLGLAESIAAQATVFLRNALLFERGDKERRRLDVLYDVSRRLAATHEAERILVLLVEESSRLLGAEAAGIRLVEGDELVIGARTESAAGLYGNRRIKVGEGLSGLVVARGEPVTSSDLAAEPALDLDRRRAPLGQGFQSFLGVPLRIDGRSIGSLDVYGKERRAFSPDEVSLLSALADHAALAIHKARLLREAEDGRRMVERLYRVAVSIQQSSERQGRIEAFVRGAQESVGFDRIHVWLVRPEGDLLELAAGSDDGGPADAEPLPLTAAAGPLFQALTEGRPIAVLQPSDLAAVLPLDPALRGRSTLRSSRFVVAPLVVGERWIGVAAADNRRSRRAIPAASVEPFSLLCQQLASALEEARLYDESRGREREVTRLYEETRAQEARLGQILDSTSDGILLLNRRGQVEKANRRAGELLAFNPAAIAGLGIADLLAGHFRSGPDYLRAVDALRSVQDAPDKEAEGDLDLTAVARVLHWVARPTPGPSGRTDGFTVTLQDVTRDREIARMKSDFVSFVTHQLRTPLAGIRWMLELAQKDATVSEETGSYIADAGSAAERLIKLVNDLLDVSRFERGALTVDLVDVDLVALTRTVLEELDALVREQGHRVALALGDGPLGARGDAQLLRQVMRNLVSNAVQYTPPGGEIAIDVRADDREVRWSIRDSGIGIPEEARARLFEKFYRADNVAQIETEGTGLGLYIVRLIVEHLGGRVWCESEEGHGAAFFVTLPRPDGAEVHAAPSQER